MSRRPRQSPTTPAPSIADFQSPSIDWRAIGPWILAWAVLALTLVQTVVSISPDIYWDIDPRSRTQGYVNTMIGPSLLAVLNTLSVLVAGAALLIPMKRESRLPAWSLWLMALGAAFAVRHLPSHAENAFRGAAWIAAAFLGLATARLASDASIRRWMLIAIVAMLLAQSLRTGYYVFVEHPMTVKMFKQNEDQFLQARGWLRDSPQHLLYLRRLSDPQATGSFGLSNVFGTIIAGMTVLAGAMALRAGLRRNSVALFLTVPLLGLGIVTVILSKSKGAMLALLLGLGLLALIELHRSDRFKRYVRRWMIVLAVVLGLLLPWAAVAYRGLTWKPGSGGEISLLVRAQYLAAAGRVLAHGPHDPSVDPALDASGSAKTFVGNRLAGLGPAGFTAEYLRVKSPYNPEEIISTHSVFADFVLMLGVGGLAWSVLLLAWLFRGAIACCEERTGATSPPSDATNSWVLAISLGMAVFLFQYFMQLPALSVDNVLVWMAGAVGFVLITGFLSRREIIDDAWVAPAALVAAFVVLVHSQIEMAFFQPGAMTLGWVLVGLAGTGFVAVRHSQSGPVPVSKARWISLAPAALILAGVTFVMFVDLVFTMREQSVMAEAGDRLEAGDPAGALAKLEEAWTIAPTNPDNLRWRVRLLLEQTQVQMRIRDINGARASVQRAIDAMADARTQGLSNASYYRMAAQVADAAESMGVSPGAMTREHARRRVLELSPYSLLDHLDFAEFLWKKGDLAQAGMLYQRALELSDMAALDPAKQLTEQDRAMVMKRLQRIPTTIPAEVTPNQAIDTSVTP